MPHIRYRNRAVLKSNDIRYEYLCAQSTKHQEHWQKHAKKTADPKKQRDKGSMNTFECRGQLNITLSTTHNVAKITIRHEDFHIPYHSVAIPKNIKQFIQDNQKMPADTGR